MDTHRGMTVWGRREKTAVCTPRTEASEPVLPTPGPQPLASRTGGRCVSVGEAPHLWFVMVAKRLHTPLNSTRPTRKSPSSPQHVSSAVIMSPTSSASPPLGLGRFTSPSFPMRGTNDGICSWLLPGFCSQVGRSWPSADSVLGPLLRQHLAVSPPPS